MVTWVRTTFLSVILFRYMASMSSWMNFLPASVRFLYSVHWRSDLLNCHSMAAIWGPVLLGGMTSAAPGKVGSANGGVLIGVAAAYSAGGEYSAKIAMCTTAKGAWYCDEVAF